MKYALEQHKGYAAENEKLRGLAQRLAAARAELQSAKARLYEVEKEGERAVQEDAGRVLKGEAPLKQTKKSAEARRQAVAAVSEAEYSVDVLAAAVESQMQKVAEVKAEATNTLLEQLRKDHEAQVKKLLTLLREVGAAFTEEKELTSAAYTLAGGPTSRIMPIHRLSPLDPGMPDDWNSSLAIVTRRLRDAGYGV